MYVCIFFTDQEALIVGIMIIAILENDNAALAIGTCRYKNVRNCMVVSYTCGYFNFVFLNLYWAYKCAYSDSSNDLPMKTY